MSVNPNQTNLSLSNAYFLPATTVIPTIYSGTTLISTTTDIVTVGIPGLTSTTTVVATYIHPPGGGASQYFQTITPGTIWLLIPALMKVLRGLLKPKFKSCPSVDVRNYL
jgi:hypothetical protein